MRPLRLLATIVLATGLLLARSDVAARGLPSKLSDAEFWRLFTDLSEPGGSFPSDNFVSNELAFQHVIPRLTAAIKPGGVYLGVGPDQNFTYIAALHPKIAFIVDIRRQNAMHQLLYKALVELSETRAEFVARLFCVDVPDGLAADADASRLFDVLDAQPYSSTALDRNLRAVLDHLEQRHHFPLSPQDKAGIAYIYRTFAHNGSEISYGSPPGQPPVPDVRWLRLSSPYPSFAELMTADDGRGVNRAYLASEDRYRVLRELELKNLIVPVVGDFGGDKALRAVGAFVREHGAKVTTLYTSNVEQYLFQNNVWRQYYDNVASLPLDPSATFIRSFFPCNVPRPPGYGGQCPMPAHLPLETLQMNLPSATLLEPVSGLLDAVRKQRIAQYFDVIELSR